MISSFRWLLDRLRKIDPDTYDLHSELRYIREVIEVHPKNYQVREDCDLLNVHGN